MMFLCSSGNDCGFNLPQYFYKSARPVMDQNYFTRLMVVKGSKNRHDVLMAESETTVAYVWGIKVILIVEF